MIFKEFAIDPGLITTLDKCVKFLNIIGLEKGKQLSRFPNTWKRIILKRIKNSDLSDNDKKYIEIKISNIPEEYFVNRVRPIFDENSSWKNNAIEEHRTKPFEAIITKNHVEYEFAFTETDVNDDHPKLKTPQALTVKNDASEMANLTKPMIENSDVTLFIDNYFKPDSPFWINPLKHHSDIINKSVNRSEYVEFQFHSSFDGIPRKFQDDPQGWFKKSVDKHLKEILPKKSISKFFLWGKGDFHDRFILTKSFGGVQFGHSWGTVSREEKILNVHYVDKRSPLFIEIWSFFNSIDRDPVKTVFKQ